MKIKLQNLPHGVKLFGSGSRARIRELKNLLDLGIVKKRETRLAL